MEEIPVFIQRLVGLGHDVIVLHIGGHVNHLVGHHVVNLIHLAERSLDKAVLVDSGEGGQIRNQADVGAFRRLDRAHAAVVAVVYVTDLEPGPVSGKAAGAQRGKPSFVGQLSQRVVLIHKLRQWRGAEKLLDRRHNRADVDQSVRSQHLQILSLKGHSFPDDPFQAGKADTELVLQQLADRADSAVAQVVDIIGRADAAGQAVHIVDGGENIIHDNVLGDQLVLPLPQGVFQLFGGAGGFQDLSQHAEADLFVNAAFLFRVEIHVAGNIHHTVRDDLDRLLLSLCHDIGHGHAGVFHLHRFLTAQHLALVEHHLAGERVGDRRGQLLALETVGDSKLFIVFIASHPGQVVTPCVKKQGVYMGLGAFNSRGLAGAELPVNLQQGLLSGFARILFDGSLDSLVVAEII